MSAPLRFHLPAGIVGRTSHEKGSGDYPYSFPYSNQSFTQWDTGSYLEQTMIQKGFGFCLLNFSIAKDVELTVEALQNFNTLQYTLRGEATCLLTGHGFMPLSERTYTSMYIPAGIHKVWFEPGGYTFLYIILSEDHLQLLQEEHKHLEALIQKMLTASSEGMLLERMMINTTVLQLVKKLEALDLSGAAFKLELQEITIRFISTYHEDILRRKKNGYMMHPDEYADEVRIYIVDNIMSPEKVNMQQLTQLFHTTERTLERHFKKKFQQSLRSYIKNLRLERARYMLLTLDILVSQVAEELGYVDVFTFSKQFANRYGHPPSVAREYYFRK